MSGHSKWATIKRRKAAVDAKRSNVFAKLTRAIETAAREGGGDPASNMTLASTIEKAKQFSVPNDNIDRAIRRGTGEDSGGTRYVEVTYEGYAPGGVALLVETLTDNRNRTGQDVRYAISRGGGNPGEPGATAWMFSRKGLVEVEKASVPGEDELVEIVLEAGGEDLRDSESTWEITTSAASYRAVRGALEQAGIPIASAEITMVPQTVVHLDGAAARQCLALVGSLEELDDVQAVYANFDISEELMAEVG